MKYVSTRGQAPVLGFSDVMMAGLASDGGLYVPESWPTIDRATIAGFAGRSYGEVAFTVMRAFVGGEIADQDLRRICFAAYRSFRHEAVAPLVQLSPGEWVLELFHGPTLAFKDIAMQLLARLMDHVLTRQKTRVTIIGATSGDTGGAAIEAFAGRDNADVFILFPAGRVSPVQQRQMTTSGAANVHAIAINGSFDDCQAMVKGLFGDAQLRARLALTGVNSINWARIAAQAVYYFTAAVALGAPHRAVSFTVPTGNFGDIFAGYVAKRMGLPIAKLVIASNDNDILPATLRLGRYEVYDVKPTSSPSMDIQVSSNFERLLFETTGRDSAVVVALMRDLARKRSFNVPPKALAAIREEFSAGCATEATVAAEIKATREETGFLPDPHTAVGLAVSGGHTKPDVPMITLATAHAAKFPDAVERATGERPALPAGLDDLMRRKEELTTLPNDPKAVSDFILAHARAVRERV